jgi:hypothetical protein
VSGFLDSGFEVFAQAQDLAGPLLVLDGLDLNRLQEYAQFTRMLVFIHACS